MKITFSKLYGTKVIGEHSQFPICLATGVVAEPETLKVLAVKCGSKKIIGMNDIRKFGKEIHIRDEDSIIDANELISVSKLENQTDQVLKKTVITESGITLGNVYDYVFDTEKGEICKLLVRKTKLIIFIEYELIIAVSAITKIEDDTIIVRDMKLDEPIMNERFVASESA